MLTNFGWVKTKLTLVLLLGIALMESCPVQAQETTPKKTILVQAVDIGTGKTILAETVDRLALDEVAVWYDPLTLAYRSPIDEMLGATLTPLGDAVRTQLAIPSGQGLLVSTIQKNGPSAIAGLKAFDILLSVADKPLATPEDLTKHLKAAGEKPVALKILRAGKPVTIQVQPIYRVTLGLPVGEEKKEFFIGVSLDPVEESLRAQLNLASNQGVMVLEVTKDSPAETAGIKPYDIVLELGSKPIESPEKLAPLVQTIQDKPTTVKLLRAGKTMTIPITAAVRKVEATPLEASLIFLARQQNLMPSLNAAQPLQDYPYPFTITTNVLNRATSNASETRLLREQIAGLEKELSSLRKIKDLEKELKSLQDSINKINDTLKANKSGKE